MVQSARHPLSLFLNYAIFAITGGPLFGALPALPGSSSQLQLLNVRVHAQPGSMRSLPASADDVSK